MDNSITYAKAHKKEFLAQVLNGNEEVQPKTAVFLAGAPGSGKTEVVNALTSISANLCHIDADTFRAGLPGYAGDNAADYQRGAAFLVDYNFSWLVAHRYSFILDGTFATRKVAMNIQRALDHDYRVLIYYVYQDPAAAFDYTQRRQTKEGRVVPTDTFIKAYYAARENVAAMKAQFGNQVTLTVFRKNYQTKMADSFVDVTDLSTVLPPVLAQQDIEAMIQRSIQN
ncbi:zeta toxin [Lactiplantibacillus fabifermentans T30PCM01]|uniref:UDP-N-acetylglucosamine kinase n=1 Tax=Lactiplantibacillus fabifermentans T30PCM01 TaxID=1400520 RepID=W6T805_9LACO|nr:zeta toxin family protein [Lactiplantibacillus fabifermentans]ETY74462.1 zeta toxin [Lactiplantibacillus fabifermentans T30PCM01]